MKGRRRVGKVVLFKRSSLGDSGVYIPWLSMNLAVRFTMCYLRLIVRGGPDLSVMAAVWDGRRLKYPNLDLDAIS